MIEMMAAETATTRGGKAIRIHSRKVGCDIFLVPEDVSRVSTVFFR